MAYTCPCCHGPMPEGAEWNHYQWNHSARPGYTRVAGSTTDLRCNICGRTFTPA